MPIKPYPIILAGALAAVMAMAEVPSQTDDTPISPTIPGTDRHTPGKVFLERADQLKADQTLGNFSILVGNVELRKGDMFMYCDSANLYDDTGSVHAFGNVRMEQGDTLFVYADELDYDGTSELAVLYADPGKKVRLINRDVVLETDVFNYDMSIDLGYYDVWGTLTDKRNKLNSREGEYSPSTKEANFYIKVSLENVSEQGDTLHIYSDTLNYNTDTHIADLSSPSQIVNADGTIYTRNGMFDTNTNTGNLYDRSKVHTRRGNTLTGDTLFYDHDTGYGRAFGNMILTDSARQSAISGDYGFYNEITDSAFVTGRALLTEYSQKDTLYVHGDTVRSFILPDSTHIMVVNPRVRIFRKDIQGICDSLTYMEADSTLYMNRHPVVWTGERQIFGNVIHIHMNDSTADWARLPDFGFMAEHIDEEFYNQLTGKDMLATMENGELRRLDVSGNVQGILLPMENDSTFNKINNIESSFLIVNFRGDSIERAIMWPETNGTTTPLYLAKKSLYYLPQFKWHEVMRPTSPDDVFVMPQEMLDLFAQPDPTSPAALMPRKAKETKNKPRPRSTDSAMQPVTDADDSQDATDRQTPVTENGTETETGTEPEPVPDTNTAENEK